MTEQRKERDHWHHTCPWWLCFVFDNPLRRLLQNPDRILDGHVREGQTALDIGCGMGYFSIPLARKVGPGGTVVCVDLQRQMLDANRSRALRAGVAGNMRFHQCTVDDLGLDVAADFALAFWMVHEVGDQRRFLSQVRGALKSGGKLLMAEPGMHVSRQSFAASVSLALELGFELLESPEIPLSMSALLVNSWA